LDSGASREQVVRDIEASTEFRVLEVWRLYQELLGRDAEPLGLQVWVGFLGRGGTLAQVRAQVLGSDEYFAGAGGSSASWLAALYQDTFGRTIDATGGVVWGSALGRGVRRADVAAAVLNSDEARFNLVVSAYQQVLRRTADENGVRHYLAALQRGLSGEQLVASMAGSEEYFARV
jgi:hypothetical protein